MGRRHEEGPEHETDLTGSHADAHPVAMTVDLMVDGPADQQETGAGKNQTLVYHHPGDDDRSRDDGDRQRMPQRDRRQRPEDGAPALAMQTERDGEPPPHRRVETVEGAQPRPHQPG